MAVLEFSHFASVTMLYIKLKLKIHTLYITICICGNVFEM